MIGLRIPHFSLLAYPGANEIDSDTFEAAWYVIHFSHAAFSGVCATELALLAQPPADVLPVRTISICPDSMLAIVAWIDIELSKMMDLTGISLLSDADHSTREAFSLGPNERAIFIVDPDCIIQAEMHQPAAVGLNVGECWRILQALQYAYGPDGQCTPADWVPGRPGILPGASSVGQTWKSWPTADKPEPM